MRKLSLLSITLFIAVSLFAQVPQALNYQAVARNSLGQIVPSQPIGVRFTITDAGGNTVFYQETHSATTNNFGLFTLAIGTGTAISGSLPAIDWSSGGGKYLRVEIAPQGGTNYTMQGTTQLLSVPYALYSEKTKLVAGNAISITNGSTIAANYQAGTGINITGNTISSTINPWLLTGNAGATAANFLGTTDNQPLQIKTNAISRLSFDPGVADPFWGSVGTVSVSSFNALATAPGRFDVYGRDIPGISMPALFVNSVQGMNWAPQGGSNNTMGRFFRVLQSTTNNIADGHYFDVGMDQGQSFFISEQGLQGGGPTFFKKMITISPQDFVGINFNWGENPTANFHTKGTARFEGIATDNTLSRVMVMDNNGNVASRDASTFGGAANAWSLTGNAATTPSNFIGTTDDQRLSFRTNNVTRMYLDKTYSGFGYDVSAVYVSDPSTVLTHPGEIGIWGRDIAGLSIPVAVVGTVQGSTWGAAGGNTSGRLVRFSQMGTPNFADSYFYDLGIKQDSSFFLTGLALQNVGGLLPKPMITISPQNNVGINMDWTEKPKSKLHVKSGDIYIDDVNSGVIMKSPNGQCWRMTVSNAGTPVFTPISCP